LGATPAAQKAAVMRKVGPEFDVIDNKKGLDGSRPITEAIATRKGGDGSPARGKSEPAPRPRFSGDVRARPDPGTGRGRETPAAGGNLKSKKLGITGDRVDRHSRIIDSK
jgi:hypothetical protein